MFGLNNSKKIDLVKESKNAYIEILREIREILESSGNIAQMRVIQTLIDSLETEEYRKFVKFTNSIDMWGGSGAVWEVYIEDNEKSLKFEKSIVALINLMEKTDILGRGIKPIRRIFQDNSKDNSRDNI